MFAWLFFQAAATTNTFWKYPLSSQHTWTVACCGWRPPCLKSIRSIWCWPWTVLPVTGLGVALFVTFTLAVFILEDALSVWTNLGKHSLFVGLYVSSIKTGTRHIIRLDELSSVVRLEPGTKEGSSSTQMMRLAPVFILETYSLTKNELFAQVRPDGSCVL